MSDPTQDQTSNPAVASTARAVLYTQAGCRFCAAAKALLDKRGIAFEEVALTDDEAGRQRLVERGAGTTLPQLILDGAQLGGFDEIRARDASGELRRLLEREHGSDPR